MAFSLCVFEREESGIVLVAGEGSATAMDFPATNNVHFDTLLGAGWDGSMVLLDLERIDYMDSCAIGWLISCQKSFRAGGGKLILHSVQPQVRQLLDMLRIDRLIPIAGSLKEARVLLTKALTIAR